MVYWGLLLYHDVVDTEPLADLCTGVSMYDNIYGRDANDTSLRTGVGGAMRLSDAGLPVWNVTTRQFLVADQRNAQLPGTFTLTALLLREHNRRAANLTAAPPPWLNSTHTQYVDHLWEQGCDDSACRGATEKDYQCKHCDVVYDPEGPCGLGQAWSADDKLYQMARAWTISAAQHITLNQYIPTLLGLPSSAPALSGFDAALDPPEDPTIDLLAAVAMGWPHTALSPVDRVLSAAWGSMPSVDLLQVGSVCGGAALRQLSSDIGGGIDPLLRGMMLADAGAVDLRLPPGLSTGDCGIAPLTADVQQHAIETRFALSGFQKQASGKVASQISYRAAWEFFYPNVTAPATFFDISRPDAVQLSRMFEGDVSNVDFVRGGLAEAARGPSVLGPLFTAVLKRQLEKLKRVDPHWHSHFNVIEDSRTTTLSILAQRNSDHCVVKWINGLPQRNCTDDGTIVAGDPNKNGTAAYYPVNSFRPAYGFTGEDPSIKAVKQIVFKEDVYVLSWDINEAKRNIRFTAKVTGMGNSGYFAFGFGDRMRGADIIFVEFVEGEVRNTTLDRSGTDNILPPPDEKQSVKLISKRPYRCNSEEKTETKCIVLERPLDPGDGVDYPILKQQMSIIWSLNLQATEQHSGDDRGIYIVNFYTGESEPTSSQKGFFALHGAVMLLAWGMCAPAAVYIARYKKFATVHGQIGIALFVIIIIQFASGKVRSMGIQNRGNRWLGTNYDRLHQWNKWFHRLSGRVVVALGLLNVIIGLTIISPNDENIQLGALDNNNSDALNLQLAGFDVVMRYVFSVILAFMALMFIVAEIYLWHGRWHARKTKRRQLGIPSLTLEQFNERVGQGEQLLIVNDAILDVSEYMKAHPGGSKLLKESVSRDVTKEVLGIQGPEEGIFTGTHKHRQVDSGDARGKHKMGGSSRNGFTVRFLFEPARSYTPVGLREIRSGIMGIEYYIRLYPRGQMSEALAKLRVHDSVSVQGPFEVKGICGSYEHMYMIAGGTGITPMLQLARCHITKQESFVTTNNVQQGGVTQSALDDVEPARSLAMLWQTRTDNDAFCLGDLQNLADRSEALQAAGTASTGRANFYYTSYCGEFLERRGTASPGGRRKRQYHAHHHRRNSATAHPGDRASIRGNLAARDSVRLGGTAQAQQRRRHSLPAGPITADDSVRAAALSQQQRRSDGACSSVLAGLLVSTAQQRAPVSDLKSDAATPSETGINDIEVGYGDVNGDIVKSERGSGSGGGGGRAGWDARAIRGLRCVWHALAFTLTGGEAHAPPPQRPAFDMDAAVSDTATSTSSDASPKNTLMSPLAAPVNGGHLRRGSGATGPSERWTPTRWVHRGTVVAVEGPPLRRHSLRSPASPHAAPFSLTAAAGMSALVRQASDDGDDPECDGASNQMVEGGLTPEALRAQLAPLLLQLQHGSASAAKDTCVVISGPPQFVDSVSASLRGLGIPDSIVLSLD
ncbi:hypothetical protein JKP88DRAFT_283324 [Tribonema minus]|uniref:Cytochrome b5 heme-binding domain-containing protein n=1 Tax=Tribonema minus TaxID=303371 RepID=A0A835YSP9_9STRA|nr:hypothetical protein JKP88DRAFT_283324 [Tribonema minus]